MDNFLMTLNQKITHCATVSLEVQLAFTPWLQAQNQSWIPPRQSIDGNGKYLWMFNLARKVRQLAQNTDCTFWSVDKWQALRNFRRMGFKDSLGSISDTLLFFNLKRTLNSSPWKKTYRKRPWKLILKK